MWQKVVWLLFIDTARAHKVEIDVGDYTWLITRRMPERGQQSAVKMLIHRLGPRRRGGSTGAFLGLETMATLVQMQDFQVGTGLDRKRFGGILRATL